jgi:hypothetical protein
VFVRDRADTWQLVRQPDHADLSGAFAAAWGGDVAPLRRPESLGLAATRHDDGWAVFDRRPAWDAVNGRPMNFLDVPVLGHLAFYRACIQVVTQEDAYAGLMVSMHGSGIYNGRYGTQPGLGLTYAADEQDAVDAFIAEQEATHAGRAAAAGVGDDERWVDYKLLQIFDRLSLTLCLREWEGSDAEPFTIEPLPVDYEGGEAELRMEPLGPWRIRLEPYPFTESPARFRLVRKVLPQAAYAGNEDFRLAYFATRAEAVELTFQRD